MGYQKFLKQEGENIRKLENKYSVIKVSKKGKLGKMERRKSSSK